jgi:acetyltransferase
MKLSHYLRPLLAPTSVALVGASSLPASIGRVVLENLLDGYQGELYAVNPAHRRVLGRRSYPSLKAIGKPVDLALVAVPHQAVTGVLDDAAQARIKAMALLSAPPDDPQGAAAWTRDVAAAAKRRGVRVLGPHAFGVMRTDIGLNATIGHAIARPGRLALVAQSGAVCTAMLDFAATAGIGFSTVTSLGGAMDIGFGELLEALLLDPGTDGIVLYVESVGDARGFLSALRAAARTKPVVILKAGRSNERPPAGVPAPDAVFDAAMRRAGTVRARTYTQLFAAARILATGRIARGDRLAIVTNGHGPGTLAADIAADRDVKLARLQPATEAALAAMLPFNVAHSNPVNVRGDATPERFAAAVATTLADPGVDAVLALHVPRAVVGATDVARAVAAVARASAKPVLGAWLGAVDRAEVREALETGGIANFYTPENAVDAFSFLAAYRRNQEWLLEVPPSQPEPQPPDLRVAERIREAAVSGGRRTPSAPETNELLTLFGLPVAPVERVQSLDDALAAARRLGFPVALTREAALDRAAEPVTPGTPVEIANLRDGRMLRRAWASLGAGTPRPGVPCAATMMGGAGTQAGILVRKDRAATGCRNVVIGLHVDAVFGPVITFGIGGAAEWGATERTVLLPPLNERLARDLIAGMPIGAATPGAGDPARARDAIARILVQVSALVCALPWVTELALDPVQIDAGDALIAGARVAVDPRRPPAALGYSHMAIHPYPVEMIEDVTLRDGTRLHVRPIRPEDAEMERAFFDGLSGQTRYFRFFYHVHQLTPAMLARFTQVDYDRELALIAIHDGDGTPAMVGVARYTRNPDRESAEFAVVVTDAWQAHGVGYRLMTRLIESARRRGLARLEGTVLRKNVNMLRFTDSLGFATHDDPSDTAQVTVVLGLAHEAPSVRARILRRLPRAKRT